MVEKVVIVTVYNACNYGSFLQAYGLKSFIEQERDCKVDFLKIPIDEDMITGKGIISDDKSSYEGEKYQKLVLNQKCFSEIDSVDSSYKCCIIGSDTVWNMFDRIYGSVPYFVGNNIDCKNIISYAASVGQSRILKILIKNYIKLLPIRKLQAIAVRDDNTETIVHMLGKQCERVLDPTFLYDFEVKEPELKIDGKYLFVYTYGFSLDKIKEIQDYARKNNLKVVATGSLCKWADYNPSVDSFEWLWLVKNAEAVVTGTFHGTIFSIKYNKEFVALTDSSAKVLSLLSEFGLENRVVGSGLAEVLETKIDYAMVNKIIADKTLLSKEWLLSHIGE